MEKKRCSSCCGLFLPRSQSPAQSYCSVPACQRERRRRWQKEKRKNDLDYKDNQRRAQKSWCQRNADYWQRYRKKSLLRDASNSESSEYLSKKSISGAGVKMDASNVIFPFESGIYRLQMHSPHDDVKMDAWMVKITVISMD